MNSDLKYVLKRIFVGVAIGVILMLIKGSLISDVMALQVDSYPIGQYSTIVNNMTSTYTYDISGHPWSSLPNTYGYINGSIALIKVDGTSTSVNIMPLMVYVNSGNYTYPCNISSTAMENSTFNGGSYSFRCPVRMTSSGITSISVQFETIQTQLNSLYRLAFGSLISYEIYENTDVEVNVDTNGVISENQTQGNLNRQQMQNSTNSIINNQNSNTDREIESQRVCTVYDLNKATLDNKSLSTEGVLQNSTDTRTSEFISISPTSEVKLLERTTAWYRICFYDVNKTFISCNNSAQPVGTIIPVPSNSSYFRYVVNKNVSKPIYQVCTGGNQALNDSVNDLNNTLNDDTIDSSTGSDFFGDFNYGDDTLSAVITAPLRFFNKLTDTCQPITLTYLNQNIVIPCGDTIFWNRQDVSSFKTFWNLLFGGVAIYYLSTKLYKVVHNSFDPQKDNIESVGV